MRGRKQICLLCRNNGRPVRNIPHGRREASQLQSLEPYDASKLLLDLDAIDSTYVRRDENQQELWSHKPPLSPRLSIHEAEVQAKSQAGIQTQVDPTNIPDLFRPAPIDILVYGLLDKRDVGKDSSHLLQVLSKCLPYSGKFQDDIKWLRAYEILPSILEKLLHGPPEQAIKDIQSLLKNTTGIHQISRITTLLTRTVDGCKFVATNGDIFLNSYTVHKSPVRQDLRRLNKLRYINAVVQRLENMGVEPDLYWYWSGLHNATRALQCQAMKKYIDILVTKGDVTKRFRGFLSGVLRGIVEQPFQKTGQKHLRFSDESNHMKDDLLRLLTGWNNAGVPGFNEVRQPCFALLLQNDWPAYKVYINALAKLEAHDALRYQFHASLGTSTWKMRNSEVVSEVLSLLFSKVYKKFGDPLRASQYLNEHKQEIHGPRSAV